VELTGDDVQDILRLLDDLPYAELQLETARFRLSLRRAADGGWTQQTEVLADPAAAAADPAAAAADPAAAAADPAAARVAAERDGAEPALPGAEDGDGLVDVRAPLLGTFYRAPRPGAPPFVTVGARVSPDTVVCIIETMKLMNSVTAGADGTVAAIMLDNAQFADQGTVLMRIRAAP
jgi:acetyl-CoA carboxylase biotin carboxyl carrier protein